ncbi:MAG: hypothetical protein MRY59_07090 [Aquisalinus sp.]|nr:hypothetical protein [Aquisalinus sp.]
MTIIVWVSLLALILSALFGVPYLYTATGVAALVFIRHLVTFDDDMPGGWSNPYDDKEIMKKSRRELGIKFIVLLILLALIYIFPALPDFGDTPLIGEISLPQ